MKTKTYLTKDNWKITEEGFHKAYNRISESIFSLGNGRIGQRANFEENYSGDSLQGNYVAGVYYPDKTKVGWWKIGYPEFFAKVLNAPNWIGINIEIDNEVLDLNKCEIISFRRELDMKNALLNREFHAKLPSGKEISVKIIRLISIIDQDCGAIKYTIKALNFDGILKICPYLDADIKNEDANYDEKFWTEVEKDADPEFPFVTARTKKTEFDVCTAMKYKLFYNKKEKNITAINTVEKKNYIANSFEIECEENNEVSIEKYAAIVSSFYYKKNELKKNAKQNLNTITAKGFNKIVEEQAKSWNKKWENSDITIEGDIAAQQGIRFNIFQLNQTYTGQDERLNIGPKGFTGEKYGGSTYWDTEAFCFPFYLSTAEQKVARNLLLYRYKHLPKAIENARKLGFNKGAALYPMVTMNGEECHNEWEITFEEIHRNGAIAYAIFNYIKYTGDKQYLIDHGLEVLLAISRFWAQRVNFSNEKQQYVMLGVTGPNEYENNINNNWHTNNMACWTLNYTLETIDFVKKHHPEKYKQLIDRTHFDENKEIKKWKHIQDKMFFPESKKHCIFLQQEGYLDKELLTTNDLSPSDRPLNQNWSWDRILRSCFIKQADVLQSLFFFDDKYHIDTIRRNFEFYEPRTVHESSLSSSVHSVLAAKTDKKQKAYDLYLNAARLDLEDYNNDTCDGLHITSMAGTWMAIVMGFGGMRVKDNHLYFSPFVPEKWKSYSFKIRFRKNVLKITVEKNSVSIKNESPQSISLFLFEKKITIPEKSEEKINNNYKR